MNITVLGSGAWGTALALVLVENGHQVTIWSYLKAQADEMKKTGINPALSGITLPKNLGITDDISVVRESGCVVIATPSFAVRETARRLKGLIPDNTVIISVAKGIEASTSLRMSQMIEEELPSCPVVVLTGPSHAEEVGRGIPTGVLVAADHPVHSQLAQDLFMNTRFRVYTSEDKIGSEICAALKNVMAVCSGCSDGLGYGDNTKAMLMTRGLAEMGRLGVALGAKRETFGGLAGVGDLIVTCTSMHSRNRRFGILVGEGLSIEEALEKAGGVVEGYYATATAMTLAEKYGVDMPIVRTAYAVLYENKPVLNLVNELMMRDKKGEQEQNEGKGN